MIRTGSLLVELHNCLNKRLTHARYARSHERRASTAGARTAKVAEAQKVELQTHLPATMVAGLQEVHLSESDTDVGAATTARRCINVEVV